MALEVEKEAQKQKSLSKTIEGQEHTIEELNANIDKLSEEKEQLEKTITEKDEQIEKYAAQLKFYEDKLGFTRQDRTVRGQLLLEFENIAEIKEENKYLTS